MDSIIVGMITVAIVYGGLAMAAIGLWCLTVVLLTFLEFINKA